MNATELDEKGLITVCGQCGQRNRIQFARLASVVRCGHCRSDLPKVDSPIEVHDEDRFDSLVEGSNLPVLVDFWADWCGPCKMMAPELHKVAGKNSGKYIVAKVNTEGLPLLAQKHSIHALPTLVLFSGGSEVGRVEGAQPAVQIQRFVEQTLRAA